MKIREIVKQILKEEAEWWEETINSYDDSSPDFILKLIKNELKDKKSFLNHEYLVYKKRDNYYCVAELDKSTGSMEHFFCLDGELFNIKKIKKRIETGFSSNVGEEYRKLYNDLNRLFI